MNESTRVERLAEVVRVGVDLAKRVIQVHAVDAAGRAVVNRALARDSETSSWPGAPSSRRAAWW